MRYMFVFLEGIIAFISPCILPMLPIYLSYFSGSNNPDNKGHTIKNTIFNVLAFMLGFTIVFMLLGIFAGALGQFLKKYEVQKNIISGAVIIILGLSYMGFFRLKFFEKLRGPQMASDKLQRLNIFSSFLFGLIFSVSWSACLGTFLTIALNQAANTDTAIQGGLMLLFFSLGIGVPFLISAVLMDQLTVVFTFIKKHYKVINIVSGVFLIITGIAIATGYFGKLLYFLTPR